MFKAYGFRKLFATLTILILTSSALLFAPGMSEESGEDRGRSILYETVVINGDRGFQQSVGVIGGKGTADDPYIIEGWNITPLRDTVGIHIRNTSAHFVIRDVHILDTDNHGILLENAKNGTVEDVLIENTSSGITLRATLNTVINSSTLNGNGYGVRLSGAYETRVTNNLVRNNTAGIRLTNATERTVVTDNNFNYNTEEGIRIEGSSDNILYHNNFLFNRGNNSYDTGTNSWYRDEEGNHWSDHSNRDREGDGIGDRPYLIPGGRNRDSYPFTDPDGWKEEYDPLPDLAVTDIWARENEIHSQVVNRGGSSVLAGYGVALYVDGDLMIVNSTGGSLTPGARENIVFEGKINISGRSDIVKVWADHREAIYERNETNNLREEVWLADTTPPRIVGGINISNVSPGSVRIEWRTDEVATGSLSYGTDPDTMRTIFDNDTYETEHEVNLIGLSPSATYELVVGSADEEGNYAEKGTTFRTAPGEDREEPTLTVAVSRTEKGRVRIAADATDDTGIERVEFEVVRSNTRRGGSGGNRESGGNRGSGGNRESGGSGRERFTDYYRPYIYLLPESYYDETLDIEVTAFDRAGLKKSRLLQEHLVEKIDLVDPTVKLFMEPAPYEGGIILRSEGAHIVIHAWDRSLPQSDPVPVENVTLYADGEEIWYNEPDHWQYPISYDWDTSSIFDEGVHTLTAEVYDQAGYSASDTMEVFITDTLPNYAVTITRNKVEYDGGKFEVSLNVENHGAKPLKGLVIEEEVAGFQALPSGGGAGYTVESEYLPDHGKCRLILTVGEMAGGSEKTVGYSLLPVLYEGGVEYEIGGDAALSYTDGEGHKHQGFPALPPAGGVTIGGNEMGVLDAVELSTGNSRYLSVTHPGRLFDYYTDAEVDVLLRKMARLTALRGGTLGYLESGYQQSAYGLIDMLSPGGDWGKELSPLFSIPGMGYLLIVGETEIVPAAHTGGWGRPWSSGSVTEWVNYTDHPYADTSGDGAPDLNVGRIIGSGDADELSKVIQTTIDVVASGKGFDRSDALLVSGTGSSFTTFANNVDEVEGALDGEFDVRSIHWKDLVRIDGFDRNFAKHDGLALGDIGGDSEEEIIIADRSADKIYVYNPDGSYLNSIDFGFEKGDRLTVGNVMGDYRAEIVIGDRDDRIEVYKTYFFGGGIWEVGHMGGFDVDFQNFDGLVVGDVVGDAEEEIILADRSADEVRTYDSGGDVLAQFAVDFEKYDGLAVGDVDQGGKDEIMIADRGDHIDTYDADGDLLASFDVQFDKGDVVAVGDVTADPDDEIILLSHEKNRLYVYNMNGGKAAMTKFSVFQDFDGLAVGNAVGGGKDEIFIGDRDADEVYHLDRDYGARMNQEFLDNIADRDVIYFSGHGNLDIWSPGLATTDLPLNFGGTHPFVFAPSCLTGNYQDGDDENIAEAFFDSGASVYIGSTQVSPISLNCEAGEAFFDEWDADTTIGKAFTELERGKWSDDKWWRFWITEYNIYGDPMFGAVPEDTTRSAASGGGGGGSGPISSLRVKVPEYRNTSRYGKDRVRIPGGDLLLEDGMPQVPYYPISLDYPKGYRIRNVRLADKGEPENISGLELPITRFERALGGAVRESPRANAPPAAGSLFPVKDLDWSVLENPNGSITLNVRAFPFRYNRLTRNAEFFRDLKIEIDHTVTNVSILDLDTNKRTYRPGESVEFDLTVANSARRSDLIFRGSVKHYISGETVERLDVRTLSSLVGRGSFGSEWNSEGAESGNYLIETEVFDRAGNLLDRAGRPFTLGKVAGGIFELSVVPETFDIGDEVKISMTVGNLGDMPINGTARITIRGKKDRIVVDRSQNVTSLSPGGSSVVEFLWNTTGLGDGRYEISGHFEYNGITAEPTSVAISSLHKPSAIFSVSPEPPLRAKENIQFNGTGSYDPDGEIVSYYWDFDDGTTGTGSKVSHQYTSAGIYYVMLTVKDDDGFSDDRSIPILIGPPANKPPTLLHVPRIVDWGEPGEDIPVRATVSDDTGLGSALIHYRLIGETKYASTNLSMAEEAVKPDSYIGYIPGKAVRKPGVEYYISVSDGQYEVTFPAKNAVTEPHRIRVFSDEEMNRGLRREAVDGTRGLTIRTRFDRTSIIERARELNISIGELMGALNITYDRLSEKNMTGRNATKRGMAWLASQVDLTDVGVFVTVERNAKAKGVKLDYVYIEVHLGVVPDSVDLSSLRLYYLDEKRGTWEKCDRTGFDHAKGVVWANLSHLTIFAPLAEPSVDRESGGEPAVDEGRWLSIALIIMVVALTALLFGFIYLRMKKDVIVVRREGRKEEETKEEGEGEKEDEDEEEERKRIEWRETKKEGKGEGEENEEAEGEGMENKEAEGEGEENKEAEGEGMENKEAEGEGMENKEAEGEGELVVEEGEEFGTESGEEVDPEGGESGTKSGEEVDPEGEEFGTESGKEVDPERGGVRD